MKSIKFALIQSGYAVFGVGYTREQAISDARKWLEDENGQIGGLSISEVKNLISNRPNDGDFTIITSEHPEFDSYMKNQGGFIKKGNGWYNAK